MTQSLDKNNGASSSEPLVEMTWPWFPIVHPDSRDLGSVGEAELVWQGKDAPLTLGEIVIESPLTYVSTSVPLLDEASCINTALEVDAKWKGKDTDFGFWPRYVELSPAQRAEYLEWLAENRKTMPVNLGYLFLYFFGLERRILIDDVEPEPILRELLQLLKRFGKLDIFYNVASHFVAFVFASVKIERIRENWFQRLFIKPTHKLHEDELVVALTWLHQHDKPLPGELAYQIAMRDVRCLSHETSEDSDQKLRALFLEKYATAFPDGLLLAQSEREHVFSYRPLNPTLQDWRTSEKLHSVTLPDVLGAAEQFYPLAEIWYACMDELNDVAHTDSAFWQRIIDECIDSRGHAIADIRAITKALTIKPEFGGSLSMAQSLELLERARSIHLSLEPHPLVLFRPYRQKDRVAIVPIDRPDKNVSEHYYLAAQVLLELGFGMALADGEIDRAEMLHLPAIVSAQFHFSEDDRRRITAFCELLRQHPPKLSTIARRMSRELDSTTLNELGRFLVGIAAANNVIEEKEHQSLIKIFEELGLEDDSLEAAYHLLFGTDDDKQWVGQEISDDLLNGYLAEIIQVSLEVAELFRAIIKNLSKKPRRRRAKRGIPKAGTSSLSIDPEYELDYQYSHFDEDASAFEHQLKASPPSK